ncbi:MAG TPA: DUF4965 domain-containing protein [Acidisarcina sp.]|nr:DUF4965 domain-containing protein [Acidisarcina sp.]
MAILLPAGVGSLSAQQRPPAVPLVAHDPYFSIWSMNDKLTDGNTRHWTGAEQPLAGLVRIDGKPYRVMGAEPRDVPALAQTSLRMTPTHTIYTFAGSGVEVTLTFFTPALAQDLDILSRPVTYLSWQVKSTEATSHQVSLNLDVDSRVAVNSSDQEVVWGRSHAGGLSVLNVGSREQKMLNRSGDNLRIDWGYFHLAVPDSEHATLATSDAAIEEFAKSGRLPADDDMEMPKQPRDGAARLAVEFDLGSVGAEAQQRHVLLSYTEDFAIELMNRKLHPYWQRNGQTVQSMLTDAEAQYSALDARAAKFDAELTADLERVGGKGYADLAVLAYRQTLAAHKLVADLDGSPAYFPKENFSNGCIATVDVLYPSAPFFLLLSPRLLEAQLKPVLDYANLPRWRWPFAPHDLGQYPLANGQVYGGGERTEENQMPVEESGNMLILVAALGKAEGNYHVAEQYWPLLSKWAEYVRQKGLDPENQLSTDDFAGHLAHNANLSIKAIDGLAAYSQMARALGKAAVAEDYGKAAREMAAKWQQLAIDGDHYKLAFDKPGTWSQKYNLVWDQVLGLNIFPAKIRETEIAFYEKHMNEYGLPLDSRETYTKLDWEVWTATLASTPEHFQTLFAPIPKWINETPSRVPLTDWYDTKSGKMIGFQARSVVGGVYIKALADKDTAAKWQGRARQ